MSILNVFVTLNLINIMLTIRPNGKTTAAKGVIQAAAESVCHPTSIVVNAYPVAEAA